TKIRKALSEGDLKTANDFLGYDFPLGGQVVEGEKIGHTLGFPTANILVEESYKILPADGVYAVEVHFPPAPEETYFGMCNIGMRPTFSGKFKTIEVHIFDFDRNIYGEQIRLSFKERLRGEVDFKSIELLKNQLQKDAVEARAKLGI